LCPPLRTFDCHSEIRAREEGADAGTIAPHCIQNKVHRRSNLPDAVCADRHAHFSTTPSYSLVSCAGPALATYGTSSQKSVSNIQESPEARVFGVPYDLKKGVSLLASSCVCVWGGGEPAEHLEHPVALYSKCTRSLTFENMEQACRSHSPCL
jgi:hypothetical protein